MSDVQLCDIEYVPVPDEEEWRIPILFELMGIRSGRLESNLSLREVYTLIGNVST